VKDTSGYSYPQPTYVVKFERPASLAIKFEVNIVDDPGLPSNIIALTKAAVIARFNGADGSTRERIASSIFASRYYAPVSAISSSVAVDSIFIGTTTPTLTRIDVGIDRAPTVSASDITVNFV